MLVIAPKDNLVRTFPIRVAVVIKPSVAAQGQTLFPFDDLAVPDEEYCDTWD